MIYPVNGIFVAQGYSQKHTGVDFGWNSSYGFGKNQPVYAIEDGTIIDIQYQRFSGGYVVHLKLDQRNLVAEYGHLQKDSIRFKLILLIFSLMAGSFLIYLFLNKFFLQDYYLRTKEKSMIRGYEKINEVLSEETPITTEKMNSVAKTCEKYGITMIVVDTADTIEMQFGNAEVLRHRLQEINFKPDDRNTKIIKKTNKYIYYEQGRAAKNYIKGYRKKLSYVDRSIMLFVPCKVSS